MPDKADVKFLDDSDENVTIDGHYWRQVGTFKPFGTLKTSAIYNINQYYRFYYTEKEYDYLTGKFTVMYRIRFRA